MKGLFLILLGLALVKLAQRFPNAKPLTFRLLFAKNKDHNLKADLLITGIVLVIAGFVVFVGWLE